MSWFAIEDEHVFIAALASFENGRLRVQIDYPNACHQLLYYDPLDTREGGTLAERLTFKVQEEGILKGKIQGKTKKCEGFMQPYPYCQLDYENESFLYEVGLGYKGLYLCIYQGEHLIAIVDKELIVKNYKDRFY